MKTFVAKSRLFTLLLLSIAIAGLSSCKKDKEPTLKDEVTGDWEVKSFTEDGVELMEVIVDNFTMEYEEYSGSNGDFDWQINYIDGSSERVTGDYEVDVEDKEIKLIKNDGTTTMELDVDGNEMVIEGIIDGARYVIKAKRD
ncbi:MAG: hypothetical protein IT260_04570 [Saprospiraceae bacterium]|nr:hypothetical protein [Saprospiraceae bacterium]